MRILSLCVSAGLWDRAWLERGHTVVAACELMPHKRAMYRAFCGQDVMTPDLADVAGMVAGQRFDGVISGIPCQSRSKLRAIRAPKFPDLLPHLLDVLEVIDWEWCIAENVEALDVPWLASVKMNAMNYGVPHQSRERWFTYSKNLQAPAQLYPGDVDDLMAYSVVAGRIYGPKRGARLQGWPEFSALPFPCAQLQEALADGVPRGLADAWIDSAERLNGF